jgi:hypothetical protein
VRLRTPIIGYYNNKILGRMLPTKFHKHRSIASFRCSRFNLLLAVSLSILANDRASAIASVAVCQTDRSSGSPVPGPEPTRIAADVERLGYCSRGAQRRRPTASRSTTFNILGRFKMKSRATTANDGGREMRRSPAHRPPPRASTPFAAPESRADAIMPRGALQPS